MFTKADNLTLIQILVSLYSPLTAVVISVDLLISCQTKCMVIKTGELF
jgi:hypothetical protein